MGNYMSKGMFEVAKFIDENASQTTALLPAEPNEILLPDSIEIGRKCKKGFIGYYIKKELLPNILCFDVPKPPTLEELKDTRKLFM